MTRRWIWIIILLTVFLRHDEAVVMIRGNVGVDFVEPLIVMFSHA